MKILLSTLLISCGILSGYTQELKKVTEKDNNTNQIEEYFVLKKEKDVKHGLYKKMRENGVLIQSGFYKNNLKDSLWVNFARNGVDTLSFGNYLHDNQIDNWVFNDNTGVLKYVYNYTTQRISCYNWNNESRKFLVLTDKGWVEDEIDSPPLVLEGSDTHDLIARNIRYPTRAWRGGIEGEVIVSFIVDSTGRMGNIRIMKKVDPDLDKEAIRVFEAINFDWFPAQKDEKFITIEYSLPVKFILKK
ncbi:MAG TPA: TonB family protein [Tenuifilaceae bacterium]|nr:TonB family protein [Tenuifilaceae bacterium]HPE18321.1 TonB family protein [Tenuifilaceae bacterium]HPJ47097.1 TonB family protein [Tenuifilaceae bacterium]HPQ33087.1 TonB family protein [Tenuifilaceae bacterium]HRX68299.1 TonB family protein [Tenuifilaceae bacterium]